MFKTSGMFSEKKSAHISETVHLRHFMTPDEYHHCIAFDLGYLYLTLSDLRRSNQGQIGKNHSIDG